jgi:hypothetical protein
MFAHSHALLSKDIPTSSYVYCTNIIKVNMSAPLNTMNCIA